jgi:RNA polymerase-associated protein CTR9
MTTLRNGQVNGHPFQPKSKRFSDIPSAIDIPILNADIEEAVEVNLEDLSEDPTELCTLLENEGAARNFWMTASLAYAKQHKVDHAIEMLNKGLAVMTSKGANPREKLSLLSCLCWLQLWKTREAPRIASGLFTHRH